MMTRDLPWAPASGQTSLRVIERSEAFVVCEDKMQFGLRTMWRLDGTMVAIGGKTLTLTPRVMMPERAPEPEPIIAPAPRPSKPAKPVQMSLF